MLAFASFYATAFVAVFAVAFAVFAAAFVVFYIRTSPRAAAPSEETELKRLIEEARAQRAEALRWKRRALRLGWRPDRSRTLQRGHSRP